MGQKRRRFSASFKARVALEALKETDTVRGSHDATACMRTG